MASRAAARTRRPRRARRGRQSARQPLWVRITTPVSQGNDTTAAFNLLPAQAVDQGTIAGATVVRVRGQVVLSTPFAGGFDWSRAGTVLAAAIIAPADAADLDPTGDMNDADWFGWEPHYMAGPGAFVLQGTTGPPEEWSLTRAITFDFRSSRRIFAPLASAHLYLSVFGAPGAVPTWTGNVVASTLIKH